jgi:hypothetical protein
VTANRATADPSGTVPALAVIDACLSAQAAAPRRTAIRRILGRTPLTSESSSWYRGAIGELDIARRLAQLGPSWRVLHSVAVGRRGSDIDHLVIGPGGVFTLNTKFHEGAKIWVGERRLLVSGQRTDHLRNARYEADRARRLLTAAVGRDIDVTPLLVFVKAGAITIRQRPAPVVILRDSNLVHWLQKRPVVLDEILVADTARIASMASTWEAAVVPASDRAAEFAALRREVEGAARVRRWWAAGGLALLLGGAAWTGVPAVLTLFVA